MCFTFQGHSQFEVMAAAWMVSLVILIICLSTTGRASPHQRASSFDLDPAGDPVLRRVNVPASHPAATQVCLHFLFEEEDVLSGCPVSEWISSFSACSVASSF